MERETSPVKTGLSNRKGIVWLFVGAALLGTFLLIKSNTGAEEPQPGATPDTVVYIGPEILNAFNEIAVLEVYSVVVEQPLSRQLVDRIIGVGIGSIEVEARYTYQITAGIDLSNVTASDIQVEQRGEGWRVTVTLPWPEITGIRCVSEEYSADGSPFFRNSNELTAEALSQMDNEARRLVEERIRGMNVINLAATEGRIQVEALLVRLGASGSIIRFR